MLKDSRLRVEVINSIKGWFVGNTLIKVYHVIQK